MKYLFVVLTILFFSCNVEKQANKKVAWLLAHDLMDDNCARLYPIRDSIVVRDSVWRDTIKGKDIFVIDTVPCNKKDSIVYRTVKCPACNPEIEYRRKDSIIYKKNTAEEDRLKSELAKKEKVIADKDALITAKENKIDKNNWWKIACIITWALIVIYGVLKIKKVV